MRIGLGVLGLTPRVFWREFTLPEFMAAVDGYREKTDGPANEDEDAPELSSDDKDRLLADMEKERTPEHKARLKKALANVKQMAAEKRATDKKTPRQRVQERVDRGNRTR